MKIYRVSMVSPGDEHDGYVYFANKQKAEALQKKQNALGGSGWIHTEVEEFEVPISKKGLLIFLNDSCSYPNNG